MLTQKVKQYRLTKGWTQQHLADACSVSLRTIQRVERYGTASNDTVMSIASSLNTSVDDIIVFIDESKTTSYIEKKSSTQVSVVIGALCLGVFIGVGITLTVI